MVFEGSVPWSVFSLAFFGGSKGNLLPKGLGGCSMSWCLKSPKKIAKHVLDLDDLDIKMPRIP